MESRRGYHFGEVRDETTVEMSIKATVERGLNALRLAMFGILVTIGLTVGFGVPGPWCVGVAAGIGSAMLAATLFAWGWSRHWLMESMRRITGG